MAKNYTLYKSLASIVKQHRRFFVDRILAFSKAYSNRTNESRALDLLRN